MFVLVICLQNASIMLNNKSLHYAKYYSNIITPALAQMQFKVFRESQCGMLTSDVVHVVSNLHLNDK